MKSLGLDKFFHFDFKIILLGLLLVIILTLLHQKYFQNIKSYENFDNEQNNTQFPIKKVSLQGGEKNAETGECSQCPVVPDLTQFVSQDKYDKLRQESKLLLQSQSDQVIQLRKRMQSLLDEINQYKLDIKVCNNQKEQLNIRISELSKDLNDKNIKLDQKVVELDNAKNNIEKCNNDKEGLRLDIKQLQDDKDKMKNEIQILQDEINSLEEEILQLRQQYSDLQIEHQNQQVEFQRQQEEQQAEFQRQKDEQQASFKKQQEEQQTTFKKQQEELKKQMADINSSFQNQIDKLKKQIEEKQLRITELENSIVIKDNEILDLKKKIDNLEALSQDSAAVIATKEAELLAANRELNEAKVNAENQMKDLIVEKDKIIAGLEKKLSDMKKSRDAEKNKIKGKDNEIKKLKDQVNKTKQQVTNMQKWPTPISGKLYKPFNTKTSTCFGISGNKLVKRFCKDGGSWYIDKEGGHYRIKSSDRNKCIYANKDGRFGISGCNGNFSDQRFSITNSPTERQFYMKSNHNGGCLYMDNSGNPKLGNCNNSSNYRFSFPLA